MSRIQQRNDFGGGIDQAFTHDLHGNRSLVMEKAIQKQQTQHIP